MKRYSIYFEVLADESVPYDEVEEWVLFSLGDGSMSAKSPLANKAIDPRNFEFNELDMK